MNFLRVSILCMCLAGNLVAQDVLTVPESSQKAGVSQRIGLTDIAINYHSPLAKGRLIWGEVVPFGEVWRAGANENTTISFSTDVKIEGNTLPAGTYGLHMIPRKDKWTIIFSKNYESWGSYFYTESEDALRIEVTPESAPMQEWLSYRFTDIKTSSAKVQLNWEKIGVAFLIQVNVPDAVVANMRKELRGLAGFTWEGLWQAADYCYRNNIYPEDAMKWNEQSIAIRETFNNLNLKSKMLAAKGNTKEAAALNTKSLQLANEQQLNAYGYQMLGDKKTDEAIAVFKMNVQKHPDSWNVYDSLAEALELKGDHKGAITNYKLALKKGPEGQKKRIEDTIKKIEKKG